MQEQEFSVWLFIIFILVLINGKALAISKLSLELRHFLTYVPMVIWHMVIILMNTKCEFSSLAFCILIGQKLWEIYMYLRFWKGVKHNVFKNIPQVLLNILRYFKITFALRFTKHFTLFHYSYDTSCHYSYCITDCYI